MTEVAGIARRTVLGLWAAGMWRSASRAAVASASWARAERHAFLARPTAGAFHGEAPPNDGYVSQMRSTWGRP